MSIQLQWYDFCLKLSKGKSYQQSSFACRSAKAIVVKLEDFIHRVQC